jgi:phosphoglycolate phosphatase-like HAD superfamily hydrolase
VLGLGIGDRLCRSYDRAFIESIEHPELLSLDAPLPGIIDWLRRVSSLDAQLIVATARRDYGVTAAQVNNLGLSPDRLVICDSERPKQQGVQSITRSRPAAWIGDTEVDMAAAQAIGARAIGVSSGLRNESVLRAAGAEVVSRSLAGVQLETLSRTSTRDCPE